MSATRLGRARAAGRSQHRRFAAVLNGVRTSAGTLGRRLPGAARAATHRTRDTTRALQALPDSTLRSLSATSVGLGAGLYIAGRPRLVAAAGVAPALLMTVAMILRPAVDDAGKEAGR